MKNALRTTATNDQIKSLRKVKTLSLPVKAAVYKGNKGGPASAVQFNKDIQLYGLWEALLYVEGYEGDGYFEPGTAKKGFDAAVSHLGV